MLTVSQISRVSFSWKWPARWTAFHSSNVSCKNNHAKSITHPKSGNEQSNLQQW